MLSVARAIRIAFAVAALVPVSACVTVGGGNGNTNDNGSTQAEIDPAVAEAVDAVSAQLETTFAAMTSGVSQTFESLLASVAGQNTSDCPTVELGEIDLTGATATFDYGDGCPSDLFDGATVSGSVVLTLGISPPAIGLDYLAFSFSGRTIDGTVGIAISGNEAETRSFETAIDLTTEELGTVDGDITVTSEDTIDGLELVITEGTLQVTDDATNRFYEATLTGLVSNLAANGNFVPESGTVAFEIAGEGPGGSDLLVVVTFTAESPSTGVVLVQVGSLPQTEYILQSS